jgi:hypothetical protein
MSGPNGNSPASAVGCTASAVSPTSVAAMPKATEVKVEMAAMS